MANNGRETFNLSDDEDMPSGLMFAFKGDNEIQKLLDAPKKKHVDQESAESSMRITQTNFEENNLQNNKKSLIQRMFSPIEAGSVRGSIFNMSILSLGSACLSLPLRFTRMSLIVGLMDIALAGIAAYWTLNLMILASHKVKVYDYSLVVKEIFKNKCISMFLDITILIYIFGIMILYQVICNLIYIIV